LQFLQTKRCLLPKVVHLTPALSIRSQPQEGHFKAVSVPLVLGVLGFSTIPSKTEFFTSVFFSVLGRLFLKVGTAGTGGTEFSEIKLKPLDLLF
jgi:hypothetical protein